MNASSLVFVFLTSITTSHTESTFRVVKKFVTPCINKPEIFKCLKIQSLKVMDRALYSNAINILDGVTLISSDRRGRGFREGLNETNLEKLPSEEIDGMLLNTTSNFLGTHKFQFNISRLVEEGRKKGGGGGGGGHGKGGYIALMVALAIKGVMLSMAYHGITVMSGTALIVGKLAILLAAILGLKKLVSSGSEKTTVEIVKIPKHSESHSHSVSFEDDHYHKYRRNGYN